MGNQIWPATSVRVDTERTPYLQMGEFEPERLEYRLSVPPKVAGLPIPRLNTLANDALARADEAIAGLLTATVEAGLNISPLLAGVLTRLEAVSSSQIEDLDADLETELVRDHQDLDAVGTEAALVRHNIGIVASAVTHTDRISVKWLTDLHRRLMVGSDLLPRHIGAFRDCPVWIGRRQRPSWSSSCPPGAPPRRPWCHRARFPRIARPPRCVLRWAQCL